MLPAQAAKKQIRGESLERIGTSVVSEVGLEQIKGLKAGMQPALSREWKGVAHGRRPFKPRIITWKPSRHNITPHFRETTDFSSGQVSKQSCASSPLPVFHIKQ